MYYGRKGCEEWETLREGCSMFYLTIDRNGAVWICRVAIKLLKGFFGESWVHGATYVTKIAGN